MRKIYRVVFLVLLCVITAGMWTFPQTRANDVLETGTSGTCTWTYAMVDNVKTLTIKPTSGSEGTLAGHDWNDSSHKPDTKRVVVEGTVKVGSSAKEMFRDFPQATDMNLAGLDLSETTDTMSMFGGCSALTTLNGLRDWNVAKIKNMQAMFYGCKALTEVDVSKWNVGNVENMSEMFYNCKALTSLDVKNWDVSKVTNMGGMFSGCKALTSLDVSQWDVSKVTMMNAMFEYCEALTTLDVSKWKTGNVTDMGLMFGYCPALTSLDVANWDVSKVENMDSMFAGCEALTTLDVSQWDVSKVRTNARMFIGCKSLTMLGVSKWDVSTLQDAPRDMFSGTDRLATMYLGTSADKFITEKGKRDSIGSSVGTAWQQIDISKGGTEESPKGKIFANTDELAAFHSDRSKRSTDQEGYVRVAHSKLKINFLKGNSAVQGEMQSQEYRPGETKTLSPNSFTWANHKFLGWKGSDNKEYADKALYTHSGYKRVTQPGEVPSPETLDLTAQWKDDAPAPAGSVTLTYKAKDTGTALERASETVAPGANPKGCRVTSTIPVDKKAKWTVKTGNARANWYSVEATLTPEKIKGALESGQNLSDMTFEVELVGFSTLTYKTDDPGITLNPPSEEIISGEDPKGTTITSTIPSGKVAKWTIPSRPGWSFTGKTLTPDAIKSVQVGGGDLTDITFQVELTDDKTGSVTLTYKAKDTGTALERASEKVAPGANPKGCRVTSNIPSDKKAKWTVKTGNARANWYSVEATLTPEKIKGALESGQNLSDMTFEVELVGFTTLTYKTDDPGITLNPPSEEVISGEDPKGTIITSTIPPGKVAKWTIPSRPGWSFEGKTLTPDAIKSAQVGGGDLTDITFQVELTDDKAGSVTLTYKAKDTGTALERASETVAPGANPKGCRVTSNIPVDKKAKWTVKTGNARANWLHVGQILTPEKIKGALLSGQNLTDMTFEVELVGFATLTYQPKDTGIVVNPPSEEVISGEDPKGTTITSTIPPGKVAKWTIPSRPGWSFTGKTLTPDVIKSVQVGGGDLTDITFEVKLVDEGGTDDKNGKGGTDDKNGKGGTDDKNGKGGTDGKGGKPDTGKPGDGKPDDQKPGDGKPDDKLNKGKGGENGTEETSETSSPKQLTNTAKTSKSSSKKIPGTSDITSQTLLDAQALLPIAGIAASIAGIAIVAFRCREKSGQ